MNRLLTALAVALLALGVIALMISQNGAEPLAASSETGEQVEDASEADLVAPELAPDERAAAVEVGTTPEVSSSTDQLPETDGPPVDSAPEPLLVSGLVIDGGNQGVPGAEVHVARHDYDTMGFGARMVEIKQLPELSTVTDSQGRFEIRGTCDGDLVVRAEKLGHALREEVQCSVPATQLTLVLERSGAILATVTPASADLAERVYLEVWKPDTEHDITGVVGTFHEGRSTRTGLSPGTYDVVVVGRRNRRALVTVPGVQVRGGETTEDPRLLDMDLRAALEVVRVTVVDPDEQPMPDVTVWAYNGSSGIGNRTEEDGMVELTAGDLGVDVAVREEGWRHVRVNGLTEDLVLQLERPITIRLVRPDGTSANAGDLYLMLEPSLPEGATRSSEGQVEVTLKSDENEVEAELHAPGSYDLRWAVSIRQGSNFTGFIHPRDLDPQAIVIEDSSEVQEITLMLAPDALADVGERAARLEEELVRLPDETDQEYQRRTLEAIMRENR